MKIVEALKELPLIEKRITKNKEMIARYSSDIFTGKEESFAFGSYDKQKNEINALLQSTKDLVSRKASLRRRLSVTNSNTSMTIDGVELTLSEWIEYREHGVKNIIGSINCLNDNIGRSKMTTTNFDVEAGIRVVRFYDEKEKNDEVEKWQNISDQIDSKLEIVNATTDLIEG